MTIEEEKEFLREVNDKYKLRRYCEIIECDFAICRDHNLDGREGNYLSDIMFSKCREVWLKEIIFS